MFRKALALLFQIQNLTPKFLRSKDEKETHKNKAHNKGFQDSEIT